MERSRGRPEGIRMTYRFDAFTVDCGTRRLLRGQDEIRLSPKAFDLLVLLLEHRSEALPKDALHRRLWPDTYVSETNLAGLVAELRRALGDAADEPRYIRTVHRFGYWFIGAVGEEAAPGLPVRPAVRYWLVWETRQIALAGGDNVVGRAPDADVWIEAPGVSRQHARFRVTGASVTVEDLGSKNGTYLHGQPVTGPVPLADGDQVRIGSVVITFRVPPPAGSTETEFS